MQLGTSFTTTSPTHMLRPDNTAERSSLPLSAWLATQNTHQLQPLQQPSSLQWSPSAFDTNHSLEMNTSTAIATTPTANVASMFAQPSPTALITPPMLANRQLIKAAQQQQQQQQQQHMIQEQHRQRMRQPQPSSTLFSNPEQNYFSDFLSALSTDGAPSTAAVPTTSTTTSMTINTQSAAALAWTDSQTPNANSMLHLSGNAYPSPEPYKPNELAFLQRQAVASQDLANTATHTPSTFSRQNKKRTRDTADDTSRPMASPTKRVSVSSTLPIDTDGTSNTSSKKELLTEEQKRSNHIRSEQKRRDTIRQGFQELSDCVPALQGVRVSKSVMLEEAVTWINTLEADCRKLQSEISLVEARLAMRRELARKSGQMS